jgi:hypothetical protein
MRHLKLEEPIICNLSLNFSQEQGCHGDGWTDTSVCPSVTSDKALVRPLSKYLSIFEHILENIHRICQLRPIPNGQNRPSVRPSVTSLYDRFIPLSVIYDNPRKSHQCRIHCQGSVIVKVQ